MNIKILDNINRALYASNIEANEIWRATQPEIDALIAKAHRIFANTRASLADEKGIAIWEKTYGIMPDLINDTFYDRVERVLVKKRNQPPFTEIWLNHELYKRTNDDTLKAVVDWLRLHLYLTVTIPVTTPSLPFLSKRAIRETLPWLREIMPANVILFFKSIMGDINFDNRPCMDLMLIDVAMVSYDLWNITAIWPLWDGSINWDGGHIFTPRHHAIGFTETNFGNYNFVNIQPALIEDVGISEMPVKNKNSIAATLTQEFTWSGIVDWDGGYNWDGILSEEVL